MSGSDVATVLSKTLLFVLALAAPSAARPPTKTVPPQSGANSSVGWDLAYITITLCKDLDCSRDQWGNCWGPTATSIVLGPWSFDTNEPGNSFNTGDYITPDQWDPQTQTDSEQTLYLKSGDGFQSVCVDIGRPDSPAKPGQPYVSFFEGDYCTLKPMPLNDENGYSACGGSFGACQEGVFFFANGPSKVKCVHNYWFPEEYSKPNLEWQGVGIKVTAFPWVEKEGYPFPYTQIPCQDAANPSFLPVWDSAGNCPDDPVNQQCWLNGCASGTDGIACIGYGDPDNWQPPAKGYGMDYVFIQTGDGNLDFAGSTCKGAYGSPISEAVCKFEDDGNGYYPLSSVIVGPIWTPTGNRGYCEETYPDNSGNNFCDQPDIDSKYTVVIRFNGRDEVDPSGANIWSDWCTYDAQAWGAPSQWCATGLTWNLWELTTDVSHQPPSPPPGSTLGIRAYWPKIMDIADFGSDFGCQQNGIAIPVPDSASASTAPDSADPPTSTCKEPEQYCIELCGHVASLGSASKDCTSRCVAGHAALSSALCEDPNCEQEEEASFLQQRMAVATMGAVTPASKAPSEKLGKEAPHEACDFCKAVCTSIYGEKAPKCIRTCSGMMSQSPKLKVSLLTVCRVGWCGTSDGEVGDAPSLLQLRSGSVVEDLAVEL